MSNLTLLAADGGKVRNMEGLEAHGNALCLRYFAVTPCFIAFDLFPPLSHLLFTFPRWTGIRWVRSCTHKNCALRTNLIWIVQLIELQCEGEISGSLSLIRQRTGSDSVPRGVFGAEHAVCTHTNELPVIQETPLVIYSSWSQLVLLQDTDFTLVNKWWTNAALGA